MQDWLPAFWNGDVFCTTHVRHRFPKVSIIPSIIKNGWEAELLKELQVSEPFGNVNMLHRSRQGCMSMFCSQTRNEVTKSSRVMPSQHPIAIETAANLPESCFEVALIPISNCIWRPIGLGALTVRTTFANTDKSVSSVAPRRQICSARCEAAHCTHRAAVRRYHHSGAGLTSEDFIAGQRKSCIPCEIECPLVQFPVKRSPSKTSIT